MYFNRDFGSVPLTNGSGSGSFSFSVTFKIEKKSFGVFFGLLLFEGTFTSFFTDKSHKDATKE
jgi:hypothetical protein